eukprot:TRINITY_DN28092_c0_g1_i1.p1 TRINITY_DN28092_c0_g1~~TRINITY_DN28092_c0_g1_i1.p1  ORF type:complete len:144 (+),score=69.72 TRINITY_DN28092_c0_g1_i1:81-512(+)
MYVLFLFFFIFFFLMIRRPPRSTLSSSSAASDVYKRQEMDWGYYVDGEDAYHMKKFLKGKPNPGAAVDEEGKLVFPSPEEIKAAQVAYDTAVKAAAAAKLATAGGGGGKGGKAAAAAAAAPAANAGGGGKSCLLYTSPSPRDS